MKTVLVKVFEKSSSEIIIKTIAHEKFSLQRKIPLMIILIIIIIKNNISVAHLPILNWANVSLQT